MKSSEDILEFVNVIIEKIKNLESKGTKKYFIIQEEIDSATE